MILWRNIKKFHFLSLYIILIPTSDFPHFYYIYVRWKSGVTFVQRCFRDVIFLYFNLIKNNYYRADGACRHVAAALYELEAFEKKSCTEGENRWAKRPRHHDVPVPVRQLTVVKAKYAPHVGYGALKPYIDVFDPRLDHHRQDVTEDDKRSFGLKLQEVKVKLIQNFACVPFEI